jgi:hypothetical protein
MKHQSITCGSASLIILTAFFIGNSIPSTHSQAAAAVWETKPILAFYALNPDSAAQLRADLGLAPSQLQLIVHIAQKEDAQLRRLEAESLAVIGSQSLSVEQKSQWVTSSSYNQRIRAILQASQRRLQETLGTEQYHHMVDWIEARWAQDNQPAAQATFIRKVLARLAPETAKTYPRSFEVYATRYDAGDRKIVALPDKCLKFANGGALQCPGYAYDQNYSVAISYEGNLVIAQVGESGPWNVDDNYWSKTSDPQPRRMFADLPLGLPEAQAAYFNNYNGGLDQFGRVVTSPVAIDISKALAADLGLGPGNNKVTVTFLWTDGWDSAPAPGGSGTGASASGLAAIGWKTAAPNPDGSLVHVVQAGQTLIGIATVYKVELNDLLKLNGLSMQSVIQPGDIILVKAAVSTPTQAASTTPTMRPPRLTATASPAPTVAPTSARPVERSPTIAARTVTPDISADHPPAVDRILLIIGVVGVLGVALLAWGLSIQRRH